MEENLDVVAGNESFELRGEGLEFRVTISKSIYPRLFSVLVKLNRKNRSEKLKQLSAIGELVESGMLSLALGSPAIQPSNSNQRQTDPKNHEVSEEENNFGDNNVKIDAQDLISELGIYGFGD